MIDLFGLKVDAYIVAITIFIFFQVSRAVLRKIALKVVEKTTNTFDDEIVDVVKKPVDFLFIVIGAKFAIDVLNLSSDIQHFLDQLLRSGFIVVLFWGILNVLTTVTANLHNVTNRFGDKVSIHVANFVIKSIRLFIIILGAIAVLQEWGYNVSGFLASMGLVGMALALAAKDTAANLFGSLVIFIDKPFKVGDWIKTPQVEGHIENIGVRSTKVRTFAQALVTVPNATLANSAILNWSAMGKRRVKMNIGVTYDTPGEVVENIISDIKEMLKNHPEIHQDTIHIYFSEFAASSLNIFCYYFTKSTNWGEFMRVREDTYLQIMKIVEKHNTSFAFPTQTLHIENGNELVE